MSWVSILRKLRSRIVILAATGIFLVTVSVIVSISRGKANMLPTYRAAHEFHRKSELALSFLGDRGILSDIERTSRHALLDQVDYIEEGTIVQVPDQKRFFRIVDKEVSLYDGDYRKTGCVKIEDFELATAEYRFCDVIGATKDGLWVKLEHSLPGYDRHVVEWTMAAKINPSNVKDRRTYTFGKYLDAAVSLTLPTVYIIPYGERNSGLIVYDTITEKVVKTYDISDHGSWRPSSIDTTGDKDVFLVSGMKGEHNYFAVFDLENGGVGRRIRGEQAYAMADGYIYFNRGNELWRVERTGRPEAVFSPMERSTQSDWFNKLYTSSDRWAIVFDYCCRRSAGETAFGRLILDTKTGEFMNIEKGVSLEVDRMQEDTKAP